MEILKDCLYLKNWKCTNKEVQELNALTGRPLNTPICGGDSNKCGYYRRAKIDCIFFDSTELKCNHRPDGKLRCYDGCSKYKPIR
jgi:hypothetical protein